ncbi:MAG: hypothetical protein ACTSPY_14305 [Candidatus Helarchaeota archaeon]
MKKIIHDLKYWLVIITIILTCLILFLPLEYLEYLSIEIVGGPPINGSTWIEGVYALGGPMSMRILAIIGLIIIMINVPQLLGWKKQKIERYKVSKLELSLFSIISIFLFVINYLIGYSWWDSEAFLGMGSLFFPSIITIIIVGFTPEIIKRVLKPKNQEFFNSSDNLFKSSIYIILISFGYGLVSLIWHCCSFFEVKMYFFFFVIKLIQLWGMCSFFFKWGLRLILNVLKEWQAYLLISIIFGICYPWHTIGFAITFIFFGILICYLTRKTNSYYTGLILLYFAYIFHALLAWQGSLITFTIIYPMSSLICIILLVYSLKNKIKRKIS